MTYTVDADKFIKENSGADSGPTVTICGIEVTYPLEMPVKYGTLMAKLFVPDSGVTIDDEVDFLENLLGSQWDALLDAGLTVSGINTLTVIANHWYLHHGDPQELLDRMSETMKAKVDGDDVEGPVDEDPKD